MNVWLDLPATVQFLSLFLLGAVVGGQVNRGVYRLAWNPRPIGPWSAPHSDAPPRAWYDRTPIFGWIGLRRETPLHGDGYWVRPLLIELGMGVGLAALYWWDVDRRLTPDWARGAAFRYPVEAILAQFLAQSLLFSLMMVATFIDFDEKTIPDAITVPGTLAMLILAATLPTAALPVALSFPPPAIGGVVEPLLLTSPNPWPGWLNGPYGAALGVACFVGWCYALTPKLWTTRRGFAKALRYLVASVVRSYELRYWIALALVGGAAIVAVWALLGGIWWKSLLTSLVGMAFGGGMIWAVRIVGTTVLDKEAMGFGDVTLMAMIGAYVGWQASLLVFFLAPFAALVVSVAQWLFTRRRDIAFGPYLCLAALAVVVRWQSVWHGWAEVIFWMGWYLIGVLVLCMGAMGAMLTIWRFVEERLFRGDE